MLSKDALLSRTNNGLDVFRHYIPGPWRVGRNFLNPLYKDTKPSCNVYMDRRSRQYRLKDFGNDDYSGDCFAFVGRLFSLDCARPEDFVKILRIIDSDLHLGLESGQRPSAAVSNEVIARKVTPVPPERVSRPYRYVDKAFSEQETAYWMQYGIRRSTLDRYCFGLEQLPVRGDTLFLTGGEKDVLSLAAHGFYAVCFGSETCTVPLTLIRSLSHRFKHIVLLYDMDSVGIESACRHEQELRRYGVKRLALPLSGTKGEKDISDYFRLGHSGEEFRELFVRFLDRIYEETFAMLKPCEVDPAHPPEVPRTIVSISGVPFGTQGNLLCVTGGEGSGKSHYAGALIAGALAGNAETDTLGAEVAGNEAGHAVLLYDTEQSLPQLYKNISVILRRSGIAKPPESFKSYCLSCISRRDRLQAIVRSMDRYYYQYGGIHLVVIDGIADLIRSVNDESESVELVEELYRLAGIYNTCIVVVLHLVPSGMKIRGHLGSEIGRKAAAILSIERDEKRDLCCLKTLKVRDGSPLDVPLLEFGWDKQKAMHVSRGQRSPEAQQSRKQEELKALAGELFRQRSEYSAVELREAICRMLDVAESTAKSYIRFMKERKIVVCKPGSMELIPGPADR